MNEKIDFKTIQHLAVLARLNISEAEAKDLRIDEILDYVARVRSLDTTGVKPFSDLHNTNLRPRPDQVAEFPAKAELIPPEKKEGELLAVKSIFKHED